MYTALTVGGYTLAEFEAITHVLKQAKLISESGFLLTATASGKAKAAELEAVIAKRAN